MIRERIITLTEDRSYDEAYLVGVENVTRLSFLMFNEDNDFDIFDQIDLYMRTSDVRRGMDNGLWKDLNKGSNQLYNSIDFTGLKHGEKTDGIMLHFLADTYVYWQWRYLHTSEEISKRCDARALAGLYYPLHEASTEVACRHLEKRFFGNNK